RLTYRVEKNLSAHSPGIEPGIGLLVMFVELVGNRTELVGPTLANRLNQMLETVSVIGQVLGQSVEQLGIRGGIGHAHVVQGIHDAAAEKVGPITDGDRSGEE